MESTWGRRFFADRKWKDGRQLDRALQVLELADLDVAGTTFVDIGAHLGTTTVQALRRHGFRSALAFEPEPENFRILRANLAANGLYEAVRAFNVALSNRVGSGELEVFDRGSATHTLVGHGQPGGRSLQVPVTTFDRLVAEGAVDPDEAGLLWVDVEGAEIDVLEGASTLLQRSVPIVIEVSRGDRYRAGLRTDVLVEMLAATYTHYVDLKPMNAARRAFAPLSALTDLPLRPKPKIEVLVARLPR